MTSLTIVRSHIYHYGPALQDWCRWCITHPLFIWSLFIERITEHMPDCRARFTLRKNILHYVLDGAPEEWAEWCADDLSDADFYMGCPAYTKSDGTGTSKSPEIPTFLYFYIS